MASLRLSRVKCAYNFGCIVETCVRMTANGSRDTYMPNNAEHAIYSSWIWYRRGLRGPIRGGSSHLDVSRPSQYGKHTLLSWEARGFGG